MTTTEIKQTTTISITLSLTTVIVAIIFCIVALNPQTAYADKKCYKQAEAWKKESKIQTKKAKIEIKKITDKALKKKITKALKVYEKAAKAFWKYAKAQKHDLQHVHQTDPFKNLNKPMVNLGLAIKGHDLDELYDIWKELKEIKTEVYKKTCY